jgi:hypothetical protein
VEICHFESNKFCKLLFSVNPKIWQGICSSICKEFWQILRVTVWFLIPLIAKQRRFITFLLISRSNQKSDEMFRINNSRVDRCSQNWREEEVGFFQPRSIARNAQRSPLTIGAVGLWVEWAYIKSYTLKSLEKCVSHGNVWKILLTSCLGRSSHNDPLSMGRSRNSESAARFVLLSFCVWQISRSTADIRYYQISSHLKHSRWTLEPFLMIKILIEEMNPRWQSLYREMRRDLGFLL